MKKMLAALLAALMVLSLAACGGSAKTYKIGICQLVQHPALDAATQGFKDVLTEKLGDNVVFDEQNAQGDSATCAVITTGFVSNQYDLIMANATPALQAAVSATDTIPILGTSVTDYASALAVEAGHECLRHLRRCSRPAVRRLCHGAGSRCQEGLHPVLLRRAQLRAAG